MIRDVLSRVDYQFWAEGGLFLFLIAFGAVTIQTMLRKRPEVESASRLPLED